MEKTPANFIGSAVGQSEANTRSIMEAARGNVLMIDEAYGFYKSSGAGVGGGNSNPFGTSVMDTLVELIPGNANPDFVVLMMGYKKEVRRRCNTLAVAAACTSNRQNSSHRSLQR